MADVTAPPELDYEPILGCTKCDWEGYRYSLPLWEYGGRVYILCPCCSAKVDVPKW